MCGVVAATYGPGKSPFARRLGAAMGAPRMQLGLQFGEKA
jgi:hypothetical protein